MKKNAAALIPASLLVLLAACSSPPVAPPAPPTPAPAPAPVAAAPAPAPAPTPRATPESHVASVALPDYLDPKNPLSRERSVFFDFDDTAIKADYNVLIERHGRYLASHPGISIRIEGNTDERGSPEYNLALGQKRAQAVLSSLKLMGARESQMEAVSWGEEKPRVPGHDEGAWSQNRRADLSYPSR